MRLWHERLIPLLPDIKTSKNKKLNQLSGQHRECCALRGNGWYKKHKTVDYIHNHPIEYLIAYHIKVMTEMILRGFSVNHQWFNYFYRGQNCLPERTISIEKCMEARKQYPTYKEHNQEYLEECVNNLKQKGIIINL